MGLLLVTMQVRVVEFPTTTLVRVPVTSTSGGTAVQQGKWKSTNNYDIGFILRLLLLKNGGTSLSELIQEYYVTDEWVSGVHFQSLNF